MNFPTSDLPLGAATRRCCALVMALAWPVGAVQAQTPDALPLAISASLQEAIDPAVRSQLPTFISGQSISGRTDQQTLVEGAAMLRKGDLVILADQLDYHQPTDLARARGHVRVNRAGNIYEGPLLELHVNAFEGFFDQPSYQFLRNGAHGQADRVDFLDDQRAVIHNAGFTTCQRLPLADWAPDWILRASTLRMDNEKDVGSAELALLSFKGVPLLPIPYLTFPLSGRRKSGLLPPTVGLDNVNGFELAQPYYWNIAPNRDATITPTLMTKRGVNLGTQFRYLEPTYAGSVNLDWMATDHLRDSSRWGLNLSHQAQLASRWSDSGIGLNLGLNRVGDNNYWRDFTRTNGALTQRLLANDLTLQWQNGAFSNSARALKWQTLQDLSAPIVPPYDRLPQLTSRTALNTGNGLKLALEADYTQFESDAQLTHQPNAGRVYSLLQVERPWRSAAGSLTPRLQLHATHYQFDAPLSNGQQQAHRVVPSLSLDGTVVFERDTGFFGRTLRQTLEPRAFYVNTPFRDQSLLPNYDSGSNDFNLSTIFTENAFVGNDRISDSNLLTLGVTSRLLDPQTGAEAARLGVAQRLRFRDQNVTLPGGTPVTDRISDILFGGSVHWDPRWSFDGTFQFNPHTESTVRSTLSASYRPGSYRTLSAAYRFQRDASEQLDLSWQWPLAPLQPASANASDVAGRWYSVGRLNYSMADRRLVSSVLGFEYDGGCWLGRIVLERLQTSTASATQRVMFQLEFVGFSRLGVSPLKTLQDNIAGYRLLRDASFTPSRFSHYD
ncbi:MAG: LPS-assembly protein LptD [Rhodoferax sp.]|nr:LPS-assembly protein LptD [Rhodoferax sp.]